jgi:hypothetical protein
MIQRAKGENFETRLKLISLNDENIFNFSATQLAEIIIIMEAVPEAILHRQKMHKHQHVSWRDHHEHELCEQMEVRCGVKRQEAQA